MVTHSDLMGPRASRRPPRPWWQTWRLLLLVVAGLITAAVVYTFTMVGVAVQEVTEEVAQEVAPEVRPVPVQSRQRINVLAMGLDDDRLRSDTMLLISLDPETKKVGVLQIPRDTRALLAGKGTFEKINGAYASGVGDKQFPPNLRALKTVEDLLDVTVHYTAVVDLDGFRRIIDGIGGVTVNIPVKMDYDDPTQDLHIHFEPGRQKLNGKQALEFVRWRGNNDGTGYPDGDLGRIRTQQQFLGLVVDEMLKPANLFSLPNQMVTLSKHVRTTVESPRLLDLAKVAATVSRKDIEFATLPGTDAYLFDPHENRRLSYYLPDPVATQKLVDRLIRGIDPQAAAQVRVEVTGVPVSDPQATDLRRRLEAQGFAVTAGTSAGTRPKETRVIDLQGDEAKAQLVGRSLASLGYLVEIVSQPNPGAAVDVRVILGQTSLPN